MFAREEEYYDGMVFLHYIPVLQGGICIRSRLSSLAKRERPDRCDTYIDFTKSTKAHSLYTFISNIHSFVPGRDSEYARTPTSLRRTGIFSSVLSTNTEPT